MAILLLSQNDFQIIYRCCLTPASSQKLQGQTAGLRIMTPEAKVRNVLRSCRGEKVDLLFKRAHKTEIVRLSEIESNGFHFVACIALYDAYLQFL